MLSRCRLDKVKVTNNNAPLPPSSKDGSGDYDIEKLKRNNDMMSKVEFLPYSQRFLVDKYSHLKPFVPKPLK